MTGDVDDNVDLAVRTLSNAAGGPLMKKTPEEIVTILDELSQDTNQWPFESAERRRSTGVHQVDANTFVQGQGAPGFMNKPRQQFQPQQPNQPSLEDLMKAYIVKTDERFEVKWTTIRNLEKQVGQIKIILSKRVPGMLPANTERNLKEIVNVVTLKSGKVLKDLTPTQKDMIPEKEKGEQLKNKVDKKKKGQTKAEKFEKGEHDKSECMPTLPFPQKLYREMLDKQFERFLDVLKQVHVNLPFTEVISQMPAYAKFLKVILTKKRKIEETLVVKLKNHYSAILQNKLPQKYEDPWTFTIPCSLGSIKFDKSFCDSGTSVNLMPLSIYRKLEKGIREIRLTPISLQLEDQTTLIPEGIVEDVLVQVDKFVFPVDFIVVKIDENKEVPLILGRPFLVMGRAILNIQERKPMLRVGEDILTFKMDVEKGAQKEKPAASVEWKMKGSKEKAAASERDRCGVYPKKA
ncbi:uncharacterized protein [Nicotiana tomentosiformis]|uniref:uncharacterized protein n=1 Tax=Nicotiana tomentosiformis TaxID=4098 RepID=UPI00388C9D04